MAKTKEQRIYLEYKMLREMVIGIASAKGCVIVTEGKS